MQFYKFIGRMKNVYTFDSYEAQKNFDKEICVSTERFNEQFGDKAYFFLDNYPRGFASDTVTVGVIVADKINTSVMVKKFLNAIGFECVDMDSREITLNAFKRMLSAASNHHFIYDYDEVLEKFDLEFLHRIGFLRDSDRVFDLIDKQCIYENASLLLNGPALKEELDRIYTPGRNKAVRGFPVHYLIETDDGEECDSAVTILAQALYENNRIKSQRLCQVCVKPNQSPDMEFFSTLLNCSTEGTFVVRYSEESGMSGNMADGSIAVIEQVSDLICKYAEKVQIILCLPRECTKAKDIFFANLGSLSFIEIKESLASGDRAKEYLYNMVKGSGLRADKKLYSQLKEGHSYLASELREMFSAWYTNKMKTSIYPQYKDAVTVKNTIREKAPEGSAYDKLKEMIGLANAKKVIDQALDYYKAQKLFAKKGMVIDHPAMHMVFTGNPGTAKTTVARLFARIMKDNNLLSKGHLIEVGRSDLVGKYVGWTAPTVKRKFAEAKGGVLFIDEAYSLVDDRDGLFGDEAINTIVQEMENHRDEVVVIFAGYPDKMEKFLQKNPGLRSRIAYHVPFDDYSIDELCDITDLIAKKKGLILADDAKEKLRGIYDIAVRDDDFGNGRYVRNILEKAKMAQASRLVTMDYDSITMEDVKTIVASDIEMPARKKDVKRFGFAA